MQVHSLVISSCVVTVSTSLTCCKARLATSVLSFLCLHSKYIAKFVTSNEIIAAMNRKTSTIQLLDRELLLVVRFLSVVSCLSFKSKISFLQLYW